MNVVKNAYIRCNYKLNYFKKIETNRDSQLLLSGSKMNLLTLFNPSTYMLFAVLSGIKLTDIFQYVLYIWNNYKVEYVCIILIIMNCIQFAILKNKFTIYISFEKK
jgi:hypothetical protein